MTEKAQLLPYVSKLFFDGQTTELVYSCLITYLNLVSDSPTIREMFLAEIPILERLYQKFYHKELDIRICSARMFALLSSDSKRPLVDSFLNEIFLEGLCNLLKIGGSKTSAMLAISCCANSLCDGPEAFQMVSSHAVTLEILGFAADASFAGALDDRIAEFMQNILNRCPANLVMSLLRINIIETYLTFMKNSVKSTNRLIRLMSVLSDFIKMGDILDEEYGCNPVLNELNTRSELLESLINAISERTAAPNTPELLNREFKRFENSLAPLSQSY